MHEKYLRNKKLQEYYWGRTACIICPPPSYPARPTGKHYFESIGGFNQHPNSSKEM